ncbi:hypothetical protein CDD80_622 [Ophiocordyceps camponoti-rufipedis]|uniref:Uncharacterized protein n=1 Tax=Ophiocordyceps camponoti-rufipedis TaxID=2004952 RepID=A0A2C5XY58_9HYPO|nr:hypothetical protein CDD80_622 [Ophiocordyceps camponoti-rufipedis]
MEVYLNKLKSNYKEAVVQWREKEGLYLSHETAEETYKRVFGPRAMWEMDLTGDAPKRNPEEEAAWREAKKKAGKGGIPSQHYAMPSSPGSSCALILNDEDRANLEASEKVRMAAKAAERARDGFNFNEPIDPALRSSPPPAPSSPWRHPLYPPPSPLLVANANNAADNAADGTDGALTTALPRAHAADEILTFNGLRDNYSGFITGRARESL